MTKRLYIAERVNVTKLFWPDLKVHEMVAEKALSVKIQNELPAFYMKPMIDAREEVVRSRETVAHTLISDLFRSYYNSDIAMVNGGAIRGERIFKAGRQKASVAADLLPMNGPVSLVKVTGKILLSLAENSVSKLPEAKGKFTVFSGMHFYFDK